MSESLSDIDILSRIMLMQSTLHVLQDESRLGEFICHGMTIVPGVGGVCLCLEGKMIAVSDPAIKNVFSELDKHSCGEGTGDESLKGGFSCPRKSNVGQFTRLPLLTSHRKYGGVFIEVIDADAFEPYRSHLQNTANLIALVIENQRNENRLKRFAGELELQVQERTGQLNQSNQALQESEERYSAAQRAANIGSWEWDIASNELSWSETIEPMFGFASGQFAGTYDAFFECVHPEDVEYVRQAIQDTLDEKKGYSVEHRIIWPDQQVRWLLETGDVVCDQDGTVIRMVGIVQDITDRKQAEIERDQLFKTLKAKNEELQSIVYVASHDLRSPLVNIQGFNKELHFDCTRLLTILENAGMDEQLRQEIKPIVQGDIPESMNFIKVSAEKMSMLLDGLLQISRVGTMDISITALDMNNLINDVLKTYEFQIKENDIVCTVEHLPDCLGDEHQVFQVFSNIISNAIKYLDPSRQGHIKISGQIKERQSVYCIQDNGVGIALAHQKKVFELFHRLDPRSGADGEGLGLTIVQRIIDRLDGSVRLESEIDRGTGFYVYLSAHILRPQAVETE
jgi:PAS domain S-box-containing protein